MGLWVLGANGQLILPDIMVGAEQLLAPWWSAFALARVNCASAKNLNYVGVPPSR